MNSKVVASLTALSVAATGILTNSVGNLAGFLSRYLVGWVKDFTGSVSSGLYVLAAFLGTAAVLVVTCVKPNPSKTYGALGAHVDSSEQALDGGITGQTQHGPPGRTQKRRGTMEKREAQRLHGRQTRKRGVF